jgi:hypothetical protein
MIRPSTNGRVSAIGTDFGGRLQPTLPVAPGWFRPGNRRRAPPGPRLPVPGRIGKRGISRFPIPGQSGPKKNGKTGDPIPDSRMLSQCLFIKVWVDIVRKVRPIVRHLRVRVGILHRRVLLAVEKAGGRPDVHAESAIEGLMATSSVGSCELYSHRRVPPISRFAANRGPDSRFPAESGNGGFPDSRSRPSRESEIPSPFRGQIGNRGNGNWGFPGLGWFTGFPKRLIVSAELPTQSTSEGLPALQTPTGQAG